MTIRDITVIGCCCCCWSSSLRQVAAITIARLVVIIIVLALCQNDRRRNGRGWIKLAWRLVFFVVFLLLTVAPVSCIRFNFSPGPCRRGEFGARGDHVLGPGDVQHGGRASLLPWAYSVVEPENVGERFGVVQNIGGRVLDDGGDELVGDLHKLFVNLLIILRISVPEAKKLYLELLKSGKRCNTSQKWFPWKIRFSQALANVLKNILQFVKY